MLIFSSEFQDTAKPSPRPVLPVEYTRQMGNYAQQSAMRGKSQQYLLTLLSNASAAQLNWNSTYHNQQPFLGPQLRSANRGQKMPVLSQSWVASNSRCGYGGHLWSLKNVVFVLKTKKKITCFVWDLNPGPMDYGQNVLPTELLV